MREVLKTVVFEFVRTNAEGKQYVFQTIRLTNATISSVRQFVGPLVPGDAADVRAYEEISFAFQSITIENTDGKTTATDSWVAR
jgi:type VI secretion system Hcp family effector